MRVRELTAVFASQERPVSKLIDYILKAGYLEHLRKMPEFESRYENVKELVAFASNVAEQGAGAAKPGTADYGHSDSDEFGSGDEELDMEECEKIEEEVISSQSQIISSQSQSQSQSQHVKDEDLDDDENEYEEDVKMEQELDEKPRTRGAKRALEADKASLGRNVSRKRVSDASAGSKAAPIEFDEEEEEEASQVMFKDEPALDRDALKSETDADNPLRLFLAACVLSTDLAENTEEEVPKVTIATCHAAKGLEFGITFVASVTNGVFP